MASLNVSHVAIRGISACVPPKVEENISLPLFASREEAQKIIEMTGVERKHIASDDITASDLCLAAAKQLIKDLGWEPESIDGVCFVTQSPNYVNQPDSFLIHNQLGLKESCFCLDLFHGCPGWVMGLMTASTILSNNGVLGGIRRMLLLDGDTWSTTIPVYDHESRPLFGDCGTATALEFDEGAHDLFFDLGTRSKDGKSLITTQGAARHPYTMDKYQHHLNLLNGSEKPEEHDDSMDGMSVFSFGITVPPKSIKRLCAEHEIDLGEIDKVVLHQANRFMVQKIAKKLKSVDVSKVPLSLKEYGNTTSASIPLTIVSQCGKEYADNHMKTIGCGFGTGLSWATCYFETEGIVCPDVIIYN